MIISALQVEKHPLTTPGPYATPPMTLRHNGGGGCSTTMDYSSLLQTAMSRGTPLMNGRAASCCASGSIYNGSPKIDGYRQSPKPHSSPKMKLRFLDGDAERLISFNFCLVGISFVFMAFVFLFFIILNFLPFNL